MRHFWKSVYLDVLICQENVAKFAKQILLMTKMMMKNVDYLKGITFALYFTGNTRRCCFEVDLTKDLD